MPQSARGVPSRPLTATGPGKITHIVFIIQEQRSFDNLFCGYAGADAAKCSPRSKGIPLEANCMLSHTFQDFERARKTGDFSHEKTDCPGYTRPEYRPVPPGETRLTASMAASYVLGDRTFDSTGNPTFESDGFISLRRQTTRSISHLGYSARRLRLSRQSSAVQGSAAACVRESTTRSRTSSPQWA